MPAKWLKPSPEIARRIFLVGSGRSGTTLLQVLLAGHSRIHSFPETSFFMHLIGPGRALRARLGLATGREYHAFQALLTAWKEEALLKEVPKQSWLLRTAIDGFVGLLDRRTRDREMDLWLEKSPGHLNYVEFIERYVARSHFVHCLRDGRDVVASFYDRANRYPEFGKELNVDRLIEMWNESVARSAGYLGRTGHSFACYEQLVAEPGRVMQRLCKELEVEYEPSMIQVDETAARQVILPHWEWVMNATQAPKRQPSKFKKLFDREQQERIASKLNLDQLGSFQQLV